MKISLSKLSLSILIGSFGAGLASAAIHSEAGTVSGSALTITPGPRAAGMGNAQTAIVDDNNGLFGNPAGMGFARRTELTAMHKTLFQNINQNNFGLAVPLGLMSAANIRRFGVIGAGLNYTDYGRFAGRSAAGAVTPDFDAIDRIISINYGKAIGENFSVGAAAKLYHFEVTEAVADGTVFDVGAIYRAFPWMSAAVTAFNQGGDIKYSAQIEKLPKIYTAGLAFYPMKDRLTLAADLDFPLNGYPRGKAGLEVWLHRALALRTGYDSAYDPGSGVTAGLGLRIQHFEVAYFPIYQIDIDYGFTPSDDLGNQHDVSISFKFGD